MKSIISIILIFISVNIWADDIRMATSEDIDLFDQNIQSSSAFDKKEQHRKRGETQKSWTSDPEAENSVDQKRVSRKERTQRNFTQGRTKGSLNERKQEREELSNNKRRNKRRRRAN